MANDGITAKFPTATVALTDFGGSHPPLSAPTTLILQTSLAAGDTSVVSTTTIPASFPAAGWITIDAEIIKYTSFAAATFTVTRGAQQTVAASHTANANIGLWFTPQEMNQIEAEVVALETQYVQGTAIASAATTDLSTATGGYVHITGTTTITAFGTLPAGRVKVLAFDGALTMSYNATSLILSGGVNYTTAAGNVFVFISEGAGNWREIARSQSAFQATGNLVFTPNISQIVPGVTSFSIRNTANSADNILITDAGVTTMRGASVTVGPSTGGQVVSAGTVTAGGLLGSNVQIGTSGPLIYSGSGVPTISAAVKGSLYLRTDGTSASTRMYVASDTIGGWTAVTTAA